MNSLMYLKHKVSLKKNNFFLILSKFESKLYIVSTFIFIIMLTKMLGLKLYVNS